MLRCPRPFCTGSLIVLSGETACLLCGRSPAPPRPWEQLGERLTLTCQGCGVVFTPAKSTQRFCTQACGLSAGRR